MTGRSRLVPAEGRVVDEIIETYDQAWNSSELAERQRLLEAALTDDCEMLEPRGRFAGRQAILERISGFSERFPAPESTSPPTSTSTTDSVGTDGGSSTETEPFFWMDSMSFSVGQTEDYAGSSCSSEP